MDTASPPAVSANLFDNLKIKMISKMLDNYKGFINIFFGILLAVIGYLLVDKLGQIDNSLRELTKLQQAQLVKNENFEQRILVLEKQKVNVGKDQN